MVAVRDWVCGRARMLIVYLTEQMEACAHGQIRSGTNANPSEIVRAGIRLLMERDGAHQFYALNAELEEAVHEAEASGFDALACEPDAGTTYLARNDDQTVSTRATGPGQNPAIHRRELGSVQVADEFSGARCRISRESLSILSAGEIEVCSRRAASGRLLTAPRLYCARRGGGRRASSPQDRPPAPESASPDALRRRRRLNVLPAPGKRIRVACGQAIPGQLRETRRAQVAQGLQGTWRRRSEVFQAPRIETVSAGMG